MEQLKVIEGISRPKAPAPTEVELKFSEKAIAELAALFTHYPDKKSAMLPALWIAQREYGGWLPANALAEVALRLERPYAEVEGVATFYSMYHPHHHIGKHLIEVCTCLTCYVCGAYRIGDYLKEKLGVDWRETTADGMFTLEEVECLDACDRAPVLQIGDQYYGPVTRDDIDRLIEGLRAQAEPTSVKLADEIVQTQLHATEQKR